jgi:hypothetical protein
MKLIRFFIGLILFSIFWPLIAQTTKLPKIKVQQDVFVDENGKTFVPIGLNYYRPKTGWAPQVWKQFDANAIRNDFQIMKSLGVNCVRVFLSYGSFYNEPGKLNEEGLKKFDRFLDIAEENGIYVHPTGPDGWEGTPEWVREDRYADDNVLKAMEDFWHLFAARYKNRNVIFAYDLLNEPSVNWTSSIMLVKWRSWVKKQYPSIDQLRKSFSLPDSITYDNIAIPDFKKDGKNYLMAYQHFRETIAEEWIKRQSEAIKLVATKSLVTVGLIQWSFPVSQVSEGGSAFRIDRINKYLDFIEFHFYPVRYAFDNLSIKEHQDKEIANFHAMLKECVPYKKPVVLAEFGMFGGDTIRLPNTPRVYVTQKQQADYCKRIIESSMNIATGWLNWGMYDYSGAGDISQYIGLLTEDGKTKEWGKEFTILSKKVQQRKPATEYYKNAPVLNWDECSLSDSAQIKYRDDFYNYFIKK